MHPMVGICNGAREFRGLVIQFTDQFCHCILGHRWSICIDGIGFDDTRACIDVGFVDRFNEIWLREC